MIGTEDGLPSAASEAAEGLYAGIDAPRLVTDYASAEMIKNVSNGFLATKLSFINEVAASVLPTTPTSRRSSEVSVSTPVSALRTSVQASASEGRACRKSSRISFGSAGTADCRCECLELQARPMMNAVTWWSIAWRAYLGPLGGRRVALLGRAG